MRVDTDRQGAIRFWALGMLGVFLSAGAAFSYLHSMGYGIAAGDLIGLRGREADVAYDQRWAMAWLITTFCCLAVSGASGALATPMNKEVSWLPRLFARLVAALAASCVLATLIGFVYFLIVTATHHSVVH